MDRNDQVGLPGDAEAATVWFRFPAWANYLVPAGVLLAIGALTWVPVLLSLALSPVTTDVGYQPKQPVPFSHRVHAGDLKIDCRYCHSTVEQAAFAAVPPTQTCMNCHASIGAASPLLEPVRNSFAEGSAVAWIKVHDLPDFVYFNHAAHVNQGIGCATCHGRIDQMDEVWQSQPISMGWCLRCHRAPERHLRPRDQVTRMDWDPVSMTGLTQEELGAKLTQSHHIQSMESLTGCTTCHR